MQQWMGAVRMRVQTADKNITIIHTTPQLTSSEVKSCEFVKDKSLIKEFLTLNYHFGSKHKSIIHNNDSSCEKVIYYRPFFC